MELSPGGLPLWPRQRTFAVAELPAILRKTPEPALDTTLVPKERYLSPGNHAA